MKVCNFESYTYQMHKNAEIDGHSLNTKDPLRSGKTRG